MRAFVNRCTVNGSYSDLVGSSITITTKIKLWYFDWYFSEEYGDTPILVDDCVSIAEIPKEYILTQYSNIEIPN